MGFGSFEVARYLRRLEAEARGWAVRIGLRGLAPCYVGTEVTESLGYPGYKLSDGKFYRVTTTDTEIRQFETKEAAEEVGLEIMMRNLHRFGDFTVEIVEYGVWAEGLIEAIKLEKKKCPTA
jgi:hypothetical protein